MKSHDAVFRHALAQLRAEGRYREFADLKRLCGAFPKARLVTPAGERDVTVWCSNDYLAMGQHPQVIAAMHQALDAIGAGSGGTRNISGTTASTMSSSRRELADLHGKSAALLFNSGYLANDATLSTLGEPAAALRHPLRRAQPCLDDRGHPPRPVATRSSGGTMISTISRRSCRAVPLGSPQGHRLRIGLFDGWRYRADRRDLRARPAAMARSPISTRSMRSACMGRAGGGIAERDGVAGRDRYRSKERSPRLSA